MMRTIRTLPAANANWSVSQPFVAYRPTFQLEARSSFFCRRLFASIADTGSDLAVFWDARGSLAPPGGGALRLWTTLKEALSRHGRILERRIYFDGDSGFAPGSPDFISLELVGFNLAHCPNGGMSSLDKRLTTDAMSFACRKIGSGRIPTVAIITGDAGHTYMLSKIRDMGVKTILVNPQSTSDNVHVLENAADLNLSWNDLTEQHLADPDGLNHSMQNNYTSVDAHQRQLPRAGDPIVHTLELARHAFDEPVHCGKDKSWAELNDAERAAADTLGYSLDSWELGETPVRCTRLWAEMRQDEQAAALSLGYSASEWDAELRSLSKLIATQMDKKIELPARTDVTDQNGASILDGAFGFTPKSDHHEIQSACSADLLELVADDIELGLISLPGRDALETAHVSKFDTSLQVEVPARTQQLSENAVDDVLLQRMLNGR